MRVLIVPPVVTGPVFPGDNSGSAGLAGTGGGGACGRTRGRAIDCLRITWAGARCLMRSKRSSPM